MQRVRKRDTKQRTPSFQKTSSRLKKAFGFGGKIGPSLSVSGSRQSRTDVAGARLYHCRNYLTFFCTAKRRLRRRRRCRKCLQRSQRHVPSSCLPDSSCRPSSCPSRQVRHHVKGHDARTGMIRHLPRPPWPPFVKQRLAWDVSGNPLRSC
jgi:hypothetical protein